ncbi:MAG: hypothetical protein ACTSPG_02865 [Candidatus Hodarchaeales archaeon]
MNLSEKIILSRAHLADKMKIIKKKEEEGGCGVIGAACSIPITGKVFLESLVQMKNRGNGKGGGVALLGLSAEQMGVSKEILQEDYILQVAYIDRSCRSEVEEKYIRAKFEIHAEGWVETITDYKKIGLEVKPPSIYRYFVRVKRDVLDDFMKENDLVTLSDDAEDEFIFQNTYLLNKQYYASLGKKRAFVLSHGKDMLVFKLVGYGHQVIQYWKLENTFAHIWIGHHRYPTKGTVWHPGGAHPFIGVHEALVHNGDFSNYHSVAEYLAQRNVFPLFLTDTEVAVYLFDLWIRVYGYPMEYLLEAMAPTTERDFLMLDGNKRRIYRTIQVNHIHGSPDGPWFFIIGRSQTKKGEFQLIGITDTSMLRPQVFALQSGTEEIGIVASERQAIDALLKSLSEEDQRFSSKADIYWNARGGSHTDGGAFIFTVKKTNNGVKLTCEDKFGKEIVITKNEVDSRYFQAKIIPYILHEGSNSTVNFENILSIEDLCNYFLQYNCESFDELSLFITSLTSLLDRLHLTPYYNSGKIRSLIENTLFSLFRRSIPISENMNNKGVFIDWDTRNELRKPKSFEKSLIMDVAHFPVEGPHSASQFIVKAYRLGWRHIYSFDWRGQRFCGCGLGPDSSGFRMDIYGNPGDYLASGLDGAELFVHCSAQDQVGQIMKSGKLVIYGDVGQTFMYGAKGGEAYILGNTAGRPLINAVGRPRVVINGTSLDYLAESFMAGDPLNGGGFVIINGIKFDKKGNITLMPSPYSGSNLFSLASGGAIYILDPFMQIDTNQLNGGQISPIHDRDKSILEEYLKKNNKLFGFDLTKTLSTGSVEYNVIDSYRKIEPLKLKVLS